MTADRFVDFLNVSATSRASRKDHRLDLLVLSVAQFALALLDVLPVIHRVDVGAGFALPLVRVGQVNRRLLRVGMRFLFFFDSKNFLRSSYLEEEVFLVGDDLGDYVFFYHRAARIAVDAVGAGLGCHRLRLTWRRRARMVRSSITYQVDDDWLLYRVLDSSVCIFVVICENQELYRVS